MTSALQTNSSKKHFKEGDNCYLVCNSLLHAHAVPQFNIRSSSAADYKRTDVEYDVLFMFSAEKKNSSDLV